jgi:nitrite reductase/ring-hydroxylating ferredoxin subunit
LTRRESCGVSAAHVVPLYGTLFREQKTRYTRSEPPSIQELYRMAARLELCNAEDVAEGAALKVEANDLVLAVFNVDGEFYVTDDTCTHGPGSLSEGYIEGDVVECNFHNGQFNIRTGEVVSPPCMIPIKTYPTHVENGKVVIEIE